jgi:hypothetical protein
MLLHQAVRAPLVVPGVQHQYLPALLPALLLLALLLPALLLGLLLLALLLGLLLLLLLLLGLLPAPAAAWEGGGLLPLQPSLD